MCSQGLGDGQHKVRSQFFPFQLAKTAEVGVGESPQYNFSTNIYYLMGQFRCLAMSTV
jgi:hypothetical protein